MEEQTSQQPSPNPAFEQTQNVNAAIAGILTALRKIGAALIKIIQDIFDMIRR